MQYKVLKIEEDMDFGCEERQPGEALMSVVLMEDENRNETSLRHDDGLLYERDINEGDLLPWTAASAVEIVKQKGTYIIGFCHDRTVCGYVH